MKKVIILFSLLCPFFLCCHQYNLVAATMFQNEAPWLKEWIEYHRFIGVEHFYLYDNDSTDNFKEVLAPYIEEGLVEIVPWSSRSAPFDDPRQSIQWVGFQLSAFNHAVKQCVGISKWIALLDIDEYLFPLSGPDQGVSDLRDLLLQTPEKIGSILFHWHCFGTNFVWQIPAHCLMIEALTLRADDRSAAHVYTKSIHRPEAVIYTLVHEPLRLKDGYERFYVDVKKIRINHYYLRDQHYCLRSKRCEGSREELSRLEARYNCVRDESMLPFVARIKTKIKQ